MSDRRDGFTMKTGDELSTASAQKRLRAETRSFGNAMAKAALHNATAKFEAAKAAALARSTALVDQAKSEG